MDSHASDADDDRAPVVRESESDYEDTLHSAPGTPVSTKFRGNDFCTIDWPLELARDRQRRKEIQENKDGALLQRVWSRFDAASAWLCVMLVGVFTGFTAAMVDVAESWMSDLKLGVCRYRFWLDREHCCRGEEDVSNCFNWQTWPQQLGIGDTDSYAYFFLDFAMYVALAMAMAVGSGFLVTRFAMYAAGGGIPEIKCILSGFVIKKFLGIRTFAVKSIGLILSSASGLSLGKEGPSVHLACCVGNIVSRWFPKYAENQAKKREVLSASVAAALSVAFGAPIGGIMFSLEEASYYFTFKTMWRSFFCALIAGIAVRSFNPFGQSTPSLYYVDSQMHWVVPELVPFALVGVAGGLLGSATIRLIMRLNAYRKTSMWAQYRLGEIAVVTLVTTLLAYSNPFTKISALTLIRQMFNDCEKDNDHEYCFGYPLGQMTIFAELFLALVMKIIFTVVVAGLKVPAGLFVPNIAVGAVLGRLIGLATQDFVTRFMPFEGTQPYCRVGEDCVMPALYSIVGAAAVLSGVMRMTVTLVIIMFELTGSIDFVVPTMTAIMIAKWVGDATYPVGIYDAQIEQNGYPFLDNKDDGHDSESTMTDLVRVPQQLTVFEQSGTSLGRLEFTLRETGFCGFPIVDSRDSMTLVGFLDRLDLQEQVARYQSTVDFGTPVSFIPDAGVGHLDWSSVIDPAPITVSPHAKTETVVDMFRKLGLRQVLVTVEGKLQGIVTRKDLLKFKHQHHQ